MIEQISTLDIDFTPAIQGSEKTERTLNDLRDEIKKLKTALGETAIESEDFGKTLSTLNDKQNELKELTQVNVSESAKLRKEFKQLKDELLTLEEGTEEYNDKLKQAAEISQRLQDVNEFVKASASDLGDHLENLTGAFAGVTGSIQMVQGAMNLMGVESEVIEKAIAKLQGLMAITEGLKAIEGAIDPFKRLTTSIKLATVGMSGFKKALIGTGIGALVVALGTLIANWDTIAQKLGFVNKEMEENRKEVDLLTGSYKNYLTTIQSQYSTSANQMVQLTKDITKVQSVLEKSRTSLETRANEGTNLVLEYFGLDSIDTDEVIPKLEEMLKNYYKELDIVNERARKEYNEKEQQRRDGEQREREKAEQEKLRIEQERLKQLKDNQRKEIELFNLGIEEKKILYGDEWTATYEYIEQMKTLYDMKKKFYKDDEVALKEVMNEELAFLKENLPEQVKELESVITGLDMSGYTQTPALLQKVVPNKEQLEETKTGWENFTQGLSSSWSNFVAEFDNMSLQERVSFVSNQISQVGNSINSLLGSLTEGMDKNSKEYKNNQIAQIVISTITGVAQAIASAWQLGPIMGAIVGPINATATLASGITAIKKLQSNSPSLSGMGAPNMNAPAQASKTALESLSQGINYTNLVEGASTSGKVKDTRVYVLESDISRTQKNVSVIESESTY